MTVLESPIDTETAAPVIGSVCTGYGGLDLGVLAALGGGRIAWVADPDPHIECILAARLPGVPNLGDIRAFDWTQVEPVEVLTAGFPCQDISAAGRRLGIEKGTRSGLWTDIVAGVRVLRPTLVVVENVAALRWRGGGLHRVLGDLAEAGYDAAWRSVRAADIGAAHRRERVFLLAWPRTRRDGHGHPADADRARRLLQRHLSTQPAGRPVPAGPAAAAPHPDRVRREERHPQDTARWPVAPRRSTPAAHPDRGRLPLRRDPDRAHTGTAHPDRVHDTHRLGSPPADTTSIGHRNRRAPSQQELPATTVATSSPAGGPRGGCAPVADATGDRRDEGLPSPTRLQRRPDAALDSHPTADPTDHPGHPRPHPVAIFEPTRREVDWGVYTPVVRRWERVLGRPAPFPTQPGQHGRPVLAPAFVEWLQGLEPGWVTGLPLPRTAQLRALGNGVVPQQTTHAIALLLADLAALDPGAAVHSVQRGHRREVDAA